MKLSGRELLLCVVLYIIMVTLMFTHEKTQELEEKIQFFGRTIAILGYNAAKAGLTKEQLDELIAEAYEEAGWDDISQ